MKILHKFHIFNFKYNTGSKSYAFFFLKQDWLYMEIKWTHQASELFEQIPMATAIYWMIMGKNGNLFLTVPMWNVSFDCFLGRIYSL